MISIYIASYLHLALPTLANEIYKDFITGEKQSYICVIDNGFIDQLTLKRRDYSVQVLVAANSDESAKEKAYKIYEVLSEKYNFYFDTPIGTTNDPLYIQSLRCLQAPQPIGRIGSIYQYTINYELSGGNFRWQQV